MVDTDYDSYAIVYDCSPFPVIKKGKLVVVMVALVVIVAVVVMMVMMMRYKYYN